MYPSSSASRSSIFSGSGAGCSGALVSSFPVEAAEPGVPPSVFCGAGPAGADGGAFSGGAEGWPQKSVPMRLRLCSVMERITSSCWRMIWSFLLMFRSFIFIHAFIRFVLPSARKSSPAAKPVTAPVSRDTASSSGR